MKNILPIIITFLVTAIASSSITYFVTVDKNGEKEEAEIRIEKEEEQPEEDVSFSSRPLTGQAQVVTGSSSENAVEIKSAELAKTTGGADAVIVTFVYSRLSGDSEAFQYDFTGDFVYQNGVGLNRLYLSDFPEELHFGDNCAYVKAGYSNEFKMAFLLNDSTSDILVECVEYTDNYIVSRTFELN